MRTQTALMLLVAAGSASAWGCTNSSSSSEGDLGVARATLHRAKGCGDLLADLKLDARTKMQKALDRQISDIQRCQQEQPDDQCAYGGWGYGNFGAGRGSAEDSGGAAPPQAGAPTGGSSNESASSYSETNTQVKGVDEADIVKNDGQNIYVLHGNQFKIVKAWPATELGETATFTIEGMPGEMFVADGKAVIYSTVDGTGLFAEAGVAIKPTYQEFVINGGGGGGGGGVARPAGDASMPYPGGYYPQMPMTKVTVLDIASGTPTLNREAYFEGGYLSARRVGAHVRTVLQSHVYGPALKHSVYELDPQSNTQPATGTEMINALRQLRASNATAIDASQLNDWLPYTFTRNGGAVTASTIACEDFYVPTAGTTEGGLTEVVSLDLTNPGAAPKETAILGRVDTVYGGTDNLYLAAHAWVEAPNAWGFAGVATSSGGAAPPPSVDAPTGTASIGIRTTTSAGGFVTTHSQNLTHVHKFEFTSDPAFPNYQASGTVVGNVHNQFSLDDKDGFLRIATTERRMYVNELNQWVSSTPVDPTTGVSERPDSVNRMFVLGQSGDALNLVGDAGILAPNEQIFSARFVGNRGYIVTFRQVDPLFVIDLSVPQAPTLLAALKIPGFSEYMHPIDETHLLTIGRDATATGQQQGLQLQIFDVTDGKNPILQHKFTYASSEYGYSEASYNHKAFTYFADRQLLAFPYYSYGNNGMRSSLELFKVDLGAGFSKMGSIDHSPLFQSAPTGYCGGYYEPSVRRGIFMENFVYSISYAGVVVKDSLNLAADVSQLPLPQPTTNQNYGPTCAM